MTVKELIAKLSRMDGDLPVHIEHGSGDYWHTRLAPRADGAREKQVCRSEYHRTDKLLRQEEDDCAPEPDEDDRKNARTVCVIY